MNPEPEKRDPPPSSPNSSWAMVKEIFSQAVELPAAERSAFLDLQCAGNADLRKQLDELLESEALHGDFLAGDSVRRNAGTSFNATVTGEPAQGSVERIGRYKLLKIIGEGGFGTVYLAEQEEPIFRRVAVKIIKPGMDTRAVIARFEAERQALAMMDHPNIARVIDAGETAGGRPYFVMELVNGVPITRYCDEQRLPAADRIKLFMSVCQAVQHAHQKGIIHRDLKPTNVLVTEQEGRPTAKVIDFGIAKATQARLTEKTLFTETGHMIGTPQYMSPEQAETNDIDIDTRSDIYSLGVMLYELLTGTTPLDPNEIRRLSYVQMQRSIREIDPPIPSARVSALAKSDSKIAMQRNTEFHRLQRLIRGDLDWVVMKCLEKDRRRRYATASGLADDLRRHLEEEPVDASPPSRTYRIRKFARKHRVPFQIGTLVFVLLVAATTISLWQAHRADVARAASFQAEQQMKQDRDRVIAERQRADEQAALATAVNDFMDNDLFVASNDLSRQYAQINLKNSLDHAVERLESRRIDRPMVDAAIRFKLGQLYRNMGVFDKSMIQLKAAAESRRKVPGNAAPQLPAILYWLAETTSGAGRYDDALAVIKEDLAIEEPTDTDGSRTYAILCLRGFIEKQQKQYDRSAETYQTALENLKKSGSKTLAQQCDVLSELSFLYATAGQYDKAISARRQSIAIIDQLNPTDYNVLHYRMYLAELLNTPGHYEEAEPLWRALGDYSLTHTNTISRAGLEAVVPAYAPFRKYARAHASEPLPWGLYGTEIFPGVIQCCRGLNQMDESHLWERRLLQTQADRIEQSKQDHQLPQAQGDLEIQNGYTNMYLGLYADSAKQFAAGLAVFPTNNVVRFRLVSLLAFLGDKDAYATGCREARAQMKNPDTAYVEMNVARLCVLLDLPESDLNSTADSENAGWKRNGSFADRQITHGIYLYRHGNWDESIKCLLKGRAYYEGLIAKTPGIQKTQGMYMSRQNRIAANFFLAMAEQKRRNTAEAARVLATAREQIREIPSSEDADALDDMQDWILMKIAEREAAALFGEKLSPATTEPSTKAVVRAIPFSSDPPAGRPGR